MKYKLSIYIFFHYTKLVTFVLLLMSNIYIIRNKLCNANITDGDLDTDQRQIKSKKVQDF